MLIDKYVVSFLELVTGRNAALSKHIGVMLSFVDDSNIKHGIRNLITDSTKGINDALICARVLKFLNAATSADDFKKMLSAPIILDLTEVDLG